MEELDLKDLFMMLWNKKLQIVLIIAIFAVIGIIYTMGFVIPEYSSYTTLLLVGSSNNEDKNTITTTDITLNSKLVSTYSVLIKSTDVVSKVISNLGIDINEDELRKNISVTAVKDTELIEIAVTTQNPEYAPKIANETAKVFIQKVAEFYNINNVHIVDEAELSQEPSNINHQKDIIIFAFIGLVVAVVYVLVANMLDTTIKTAEEIEKYFKVPVLASIPVCDLEGALDKRRGGRR